MSDKNVTGVLRHSIFFRYFKKRPDLSEESMSEYGSRMEIALENNLNDLKSDLLNSGIKAVNFSGRTEFLKNERRVRLPILSLEVKGVEDSFEARVSISPCIGSSPRTKITTSPRYDGVLNKKRLLDFFEVARDISEIVSEAVRKFYFVHANACFKEMGVIEYIVPEGVEPIERYDLDVAMIGGEIEAFKDLINSSDDDSAMERLIQHNTSLSDALDVLENVRVPNKEYEWFVREKGGDEGLCGFYGDKKHGSFIGLTYPGSYALSKDLVEGIIMSS